MNDVQEALLASPKTNSVKVNHSLDCTQAFERKRPPRRSPWDIIAPPQLFIMRRRKKKVKAAVMNGAYLG